MLFSCLEKNIEKKQKHRNKQVEYSANEYVIHCCHNKTWDGSVFELGYHNHSYLQNYSTESNTVFSIMFENQLTLHPASFEGVLLFWDTLYKSHIFVYDLVAYVSILFWKADTSSDKQIRVMWFTFLPIIVVVTSINHGRKYERTVIPLLSCQEVIQANIDIGAAKASNVILILSNSERKHATGSIQQMLQGFMVVK